MPWVTTFFFIKNYQCFSFCFFVEGTRIKIEFLILTQIDYYHCATIADDKILIKKIQTKVMSQG